MNWFRRLMQNTGRFIKEVRVEMQKVAWPTREELIAATTVVIIATFLVSMYIFGLDKAIQYYVIGNIF